MTIVALAGCGATQTVTQTQTASVTITQTITATDTKVVPMTVIETATATTPTVSTAQSRPNGALCASLYSQWQAGGVDAQPAIVQYGQMGCDLNAAATAGEWCKTVTSTASDVPGYPAGQKQDICSYAPHTRGTHPPP